MANKIYKLSSEVVSYPSMGAWHFVVVDKKESDEIKSKHKPAAGNGFGSIRVSVTIGQTTWDTSIFPDKKSGMYLLPVKAAVRKKEGIARDEEQVNFTLQVRK